MITHAASIQDTHWRRGHPILPRGPAMSLICHPAIMFAASICFPPREGDRGLSERDQRRSPTDKDRHTRGVNARRA